MSLSSLSQSIDHLHHSTGKEDYDELKACFGQKFEEIDQLKTTGITIDGEHFDIEWWVLILLQDVIIIFP